MLPTSCRQLATSSQAPRRQEFPPPRRFSRRDLSSKLCHPAKKIQAQFDVVRRLAILREYREHVVQRFNALPIPALVRFPAHRAGGGDIDADIRKFTERAGEIDPRLHGLALLG